MASSPVPKDISQEDTKCPCSSSLPLSSSASLPSSSPPHIQPIPLFKVYMSPDAKDEVGKVLDSGYITQGPKVDQFESEMKAKIFQNYPYLLSLHSGTDALSLAVRLLDLSFSDEIISPALTCTATNWAILENRVRIKWADVDPETCNINLDDVEKKLTENTKAIMVVHWGGYPVDLDRLRQIQLKYESTYQHPLYIIEDCAHALGATYNGKPIGTHGNICCFSLQAIKHLTCGDGGLILLPDEKMYQRAKRLRWFGIDRDQRSKGDFRLEADIPEWGYKYHMNDINATIGLCNLPHFPSILKAHQDNADYYDRELINIPGIQLLSRHSNRKGSMWIYSLRVTDKPGFIEFMTSKKIMVSQVHNRNDHHSCVKEFQCLLPLLDQLEKELIAIPNGWWITPAQREYIVQCIKEWSDTFSLRLLSASDYHKGFLSLLSQLTQYPYALSESEFQSRLNTISHSSACIDVLERQSRIIASMKLVLVPTFSDSYVHVEEIVVDSALRNRGIGKWMVSHIPHLLSSRNIHAYKLVLECKPSLVLFYRSCGYIEEGTEMVYRLPSV